MMSGNPAKSLGSSHLVLPSPNHKDTVMPFASTAPHFSTNIGIGSISNIISQMPEHPVINIDCQSRDEIKSSIQLLYHWTISQRLKNASITGQHLGGLIVVGFASLVSDWWENLPTNARNGMLFSDDGD